MRTIVCLSCFCALVSLGAATSLAQSRIAPRTVAYYGETISGVTLSQVGFPTFAQVQIDTAGNVFFGSNESTGTQYWLEYPSPGTVVSLGTGPYFPILSASGTLATLRYQGSSSDLQTTNGSSSGGSVNWTTIAAESSYGDIGFPSINAAGNAVGFFGQTNSAMYAYRGGSIATVATSGGSISASAFPSGYKYGFLGDQPAINGSGNLAFYAPYSTTPGGSYVGNAVFKESGSSHTLSAVAYTGATAPGTSGATFQDISPEIYPLQPAGFNDAGQVVFGATTSDSRSGVWTDASGSLTNVALSGQTAPDTGGQTFSGGWASNPGSSIPHTFGTPSINGNGRIEFFASLNNSTGPAGLFTMSPPSGGSPGTLDAVGASTGTPVVVGQPAWHNASWNYGSFPTLQISIFVNLQYPVGAAMNGVGLSSIFQATLTNGTSTTTAIMSVDPYGNVLPAVLAGTDTITVGGTTYPVEAVSIPNLLQNSGGQDGFGTILNSNGYFPYTATYNNGTADVTAVEVGRVALYGDANFDGVVNGLDTALIASHWLSHQTPGENGDVNYDGVVNGLDSSLVASNWLHTLTSPTGVPVPEPSALILAALAMGVFMCRAVRNNPLNRSR